jgi:hypothetical protein
MSKLGWGREVCVCSCECGEVTDEFVANTNIRSGRNNCNNNGNECVVRDKGLFSLFNTHMFNLLLGGGDEKKCIY